MKGYINKESRNRFNGRINARKSVLFISVVLLFVLLLCGTATAVPAKPANLSFDHSYVLSWDLDESVSRYFCYFQLKTNGKYAGNGSISIYNPDYNPTYNYNRWTAEGARASYDLATTVRDIIIENYLVNQPVSVMVQLKPYASNGASGDYSGYTDEISVTINADIPEIAMPANLVLADNAVLTWDADEDVNYSYSYSVYVNIEGKGAYSQTGIFYNPAAFESSSVSKWIENGESRSFDFSSVIMRVLTNHDAAGCLPAVKIWLRPTSKVIIEEKSYNISGPQSEYSNLINYRPECIVNSITIDPLAPVMRPGDTMKLNVQVESDDAYYSAPEWTSSDETIVKITEAGKLTARKTGTAVITATIGQVSTSATVCVYPIESNIPDTEAKSWSIRTAGTIISAINNGAEPDISNTDIPETAMDGLRTQISSGFARGDTVHVDLKARTLDWDRFSDRQEEILQLVPGGIFAFACKPEVEFYQLDLQGQKSHIGSIVKFDESMELTIDLPELPALQAGCIRKYALLQIQNNRIKQIPITVANGKYTAKTDLRSEWLLLYKDEELILSTDKESYLINDEITFTVSTSEMTNYRLYHGEDIYYSGDNLYAGTVSAYTNNLGTGEHTFRMECSFDDGNTWIPSNEVSFPIEKLGDATFTATFQETEIRQGDDLVINISNAAHVDYFYLSWESGYNPNQPHFDGDCQEIRISTLGMLSGSHRIAVGVNALPGYESPKSTYKTITITVNPDYETGEIFIDGPDTIQVGENALYMIYAKNASSLSVQMDDNYPAYYYTSAHSYIAPWFRADQTGEHTLRISAGSNSTTKTVTVVCDKDLKLTDIQQPVRIFAGDEVTIPIRKPADIEYMDITVYWNEETLFTANHITSDYSIHLTGEQTEDLQGFAVYVNAWYEGKIISYYSDYTMVETASDYITFAADRQSCEAGEDITFDITIEQDLSDAILMIGEEAYQLNKNRLYEDADHTMTVSLNTEGEYTAYIRFCLEDGTWTDSDSIILTVGSVILEPIANPPAGLTAICGETLADVMLINPEGNTPGTWTWADDGTTSVGNEGEHIFKANFTPTDTAKYKNKENVDVRVTVIKAAAVAATVIANKLTYNEEAQVLVTVTGEPVGGTMNYALGTDDKTVPAEGWFETIPTGRDFGIYYVWYKAVGDDNHLSSAAAAVKAIICPIYEEATFILPAEVTTIEEYAFAGDKSITTVDASNCTFIGEGAFSGCDGLVWIRLPGDCDHIAETAFPENRTVFLFVPADSITEDHYVSNDHMIFLPLNPNT